MHHALLMGVGLTLTALLLFLPALYMQGAAGLELPIHSMVLMFMPLPVLLLATVSKREWIRLWLFPCSHLIALVTIPELSSPRLYQGLEGLAAFGVLVLVGGIYISVVIRGSFSKIDAISSPTDEPSSSRELPVEGLTLALATMILGSFLAGIFLEAGKDRLSPIITILAGLLTTWLVLGRLWYPRLLKPLSDANEQKVMAHEVTFLEQISRQHLITAVFIVVLTLSMLLVFHGIM